MDRESVMVLHQRLMQDVEFIRSRKELNVTLLTKLMQKSTTWFSLTKLIATHTILLKPSFIQIRLFWHY